VQLSAPASKSDEFQDHERECKRLKAECGVTAANEWETAALDTTGRAARALIDTPAKTLAGLILQGAICRGSLRRRL
jgi:hypothetical protein